MKLSPLEISQREFARRFRGFDPGEVRAFLEEVASEMEELMRESRLRDERIRQLEEQVATLAEREGALRTTLMTAQKMTEEIKENAKREADLVRKEAELNAEKILESAHGKLAQVQADIADLERQKSLFRAKLRALLKVHLELLDFEATVETVLVDQAREDLEPGARLTGGITFDPGCPAEEALRNWQAMVDGLRREA